MRAKKLKAKTQTQMTEYEYFELLRSQIPPIADTDDPNLYALSCKAHDDAWDSLYAAIDAFRAEHPERFATGWPHL